ncbi:hypothetical protein RND81_03G063200 [Saponaria officinalis]|uniref:Uncharacterized protein n=1 Tax=Saponaria officinalis TaxID=3572 RepID=A0AAW1M4E2_SAPOF
MDVPSNLQKQKSKTYHKSDFRSYKHNELSQTWGLLHNINNIKYSIHNTKTRNIPSSHGSSSYPSRSPQPSWEHHPPASRHSENPHTHSQPRRKTLGAGEPSPGRKPARKTGSFFAKMTTKTNKQTNKQTKTYQDLPRSQPPRKIPVVKVRDQQKVAQPLEVS